MTSSCPTWASWSAGVIFMLPVGGGSILSRAIRISPLGLPEFHLLDREVPPATKLPQQAAEIVSRGPTAGLPDAAAVP